VGEIPRQADHAVSASWAATGHLIRVQDLVTMINAGGLGRVLSERQLHRHRLAADRSFEVRIGRSRQDARVDVLRYIAWVFDRVHGSGDSSTHPVAGDVTYAGVFGLLERQSYRCALSGRTLAPDSSSLDHITPVSRGGPHRIENAQMLHAEVNRAKAALTNSEFIALCREVVAWADRSISSSNSNSNSN
jgi:5-methylcytosine-specific restriction endonuclease McrA